MIDERKTVLVSPNSVKGYAEPKFVLEFDGKVYVTLGVLEYDPAKEQMDDDERADLNELQSMLADSRPVSGTVFNGEDRIATMAQAQSRDN